MSSGIVSSSPPQISGKGNSDNGVKNPTSHKSPVIHKDPLQRHHHAVTVLPSSMPSARSSGLTPRAGNKAQYHMTQHQGSPPSSISMCGQEVNPKPTVFHSPLPDLTPFLWATPKNKMPEFQSPQISAEHSLFSNILTMPSPSPVSLSKRAGGVSSLISDPTLGSFSGSGLNQAQHQPLNTASASANNLHAIPTVSSPRAINVAPNTGLSLEQLEAGLVSDSLPLGYFRQPSPGEKAKSWPYIAISRGILNQQELAHKEGHVPQLRLDTPNGKGPRKRLQMKREGMGDDGRRRDGYDDDLRPEKKKRAPRRGEYKCGKCGFFPKKDEHDCNEVLRKKKETLGKIDGNSNADPSSTDKTEKMEKIPKIGKMGMISSVMEIPTSPSDQNLGHVIVPGTEVSPTMMNTKEGSELECKRMSVSEFISGSQIEAH